MILLVIQSPDYIRYIWQDLKKFPTLLSHPKLNKKEHAFACQTGIATLLATIIIWFFHLPFPFWGAISAFVASQLYIGAQIDRALQRTLGAWFGCLSGFLLAGFVVTWDSLFAGISIFIFSWLALYWTATVKRSNYFWMYAGVHIPLILLLSISFPPEPVFQIAFYRPILITLGALLAVVVTFCFKRASTGVWQNARNSWLKDYAAWIDQVSKSSKIESGDLEDIIKKLVSLREQLPNLQQKMFFAALEHPSWLIHIAGWKNQLSMLDNLLLFFWQTLQTQLLCTTTRPAQLHSLKEWVHQLIPNLLKPGADKKAVYAGCTQFLKNCPHSLKAHLNHCFQPLLKKGPFVPYVQSKLIQHRIYTPAIRYAIRGACALLLTAFLFFWLRVPGGVLNMAIAVITVVQIDFFSAYHRGSQRFLGCLIGVTVGLLILLFNPSNIIIILILIFMGVYAAAILMQCGAGCNYLGIQAGVAFLIVTVNSAPSINNFYAGLERTVGIILGVAVTWILNKALWPNEYQRQVRAHQQALTEHYHQTQHQLEQALVQPSSLHLPSIDFQALRDLTKPTMGEQPDTALKEKFTRQARALNLIRFAYMHFFQQHEQFPEPFKQWLRGAISLVSALTSETEKRKALDQLFKKSQCFLQQHPTSPQSQKDFIHLILKLYI